jgi:hypothetical protein
VGIGKDLGERIGHVVGEFVLLDPVPHVEVEVTARLEDPARLRERGGLVGERTWCRN